MARQAGPYKITGTIDHICFYKMDGQYYARQKSSLTGKRVKKDPAFARTMQNSSLFGRASRLASQIKRGFPKEEQNLELYRQLLRKAKLWLKEGIAEEEIKLRLCFVPEQENNKQLTNHTKKAVKILNATGYQAVFALPVGYLANHDSNRFIKRRVVVTARTRLSCASP